MKKKFGYTLVEIIVVCGIIAVFAGLGIAYFNQFADQNLTLREGKKLVDVLELAKSKTNTQDLPTDASKCQGLFLGYIVSVTPTGYSLKIKCQVGNNPYVINTLQTFIFDTRISSSATVDIQFQPLNQPVLFSPAQINNFKIIQLTNSRLAGLAVQGCYSIKVDSFGLITDNQITCQAPI